MAQMDRTSANATMTTAAPGADCAGQEQVEQNLATFERLDFEGWNGRNWELFRQLHTDDVKVVGFGSTTVGIDAHTEWAQSFIASNPESKIMTHTIRVAAGDWTSVTGVMNDGLVMGHHRALGERPDRRRVSLHPQRLTRKPVRPGLLLIY